MENASKALIIAGAILLSILIISLGIMVYNNAKNTAQSGNLDQHEISAFNSQWEAYVGKSKTASEVTTLIQALIVNNATQTSKGTNRWIDLQTKDVSKVTTVPTKAPSITLPSLSNANTYDVTLGYGTSGLVVAVGYVVHK